MALRACGPAHDHLQTQARVSVRRLCERLRIVYTALTTDELVRIEGLTLRYVHQCHALPVVAGPYPGYGRELWNAANWVRASRVAPFRTHSRSRALAAPLPLMFRAS